MKRFKKALAALLALLMITSASAALGGCELPSGTQPTAQTAQQAQASELCGAQEAEFKEPRDDWQKAEYTNIVLSGSGAQISGAGCTCENGTLNITQKGVYVLSGSFDGQVRVKTDDGKGKVELVLCGAEITCADSCPIYIESCKTAYITLADGTDNTLTDGASYTLEDASSDEPNAAVFSRSDLVFGGSGRLTVNANYNNGIRSKDDLQFLGGTYAINAKNHAVSGKDSLAVADGVFTIQAGGDGLKSTGSGTAEKPAGWVHIAGGSFIISCGSDGVQAETSMNITGGELSISAPGEGSQGLKAAGELRVSGGVVNITRSNEGIQAATVDIRGGELNIVSADDGINATSDSGSDAPGGEFAAQSGVYVSISGGNVYINANGDGIDSNGDLLVSGGVLVIDGPTSSGDGALDYNGKCAVTGGTLLAAGSRGMAQGTGEGTTQPSVTLSFDKPVQAGTFVAVTDSSGNVVAGHECAKEVSSIIISAPALTAGESYNVCVGGTVEGAESANGLYTSGRLSGDYTQTGTVTAIVSDRSAMFGGGPGGQRPDDNGNPPEPPEGFGGQRPDDNGNPPEPPEGVGGQRPDDNGNPPEPPEGFGGQRPDDGGNPPEPRAM